MADLLIEKSFCPVVTFNKITLEDSDTGDELVVTVEVKVTEDESTGFLSNPDLNKYLKFKTIQSTDPVKTANMLNPTKKSPSSRKYANLGTISTENKLKVVEYSISDILASRHSTRHRVLKGGGNSSVINDLYTNGGEFQLPDGSGYQGFYHIHPELGPMVGRGHTEVPHDRLTIISGGAKIIIPFTFQFTIPNSSNLKHLSYFVFSYYDFENMGFDMDLPEDYRKISGLVESREVIRKGSLHGLGDSVIQDFRSIKRLSKLNIRPSLLGTDAPAKIDRVALKLNDSLKLVQNSAYFSDFFVTRDKGGHSRFLFGIDMRKLLLENSVFGRYFTNAPSDAFNDIMLDTKINRIKVFRRRVVPLPGSNKLGGNSVNERLFDPNEPEKTVISASERVRNGVAVSAKIDKRTDIGSIKEANILNGPEYMYVKHFIGSDLGMEDESYGHYQYGVELEIEDGTIDYFISKYQGLKSSKTKLEEYINILNIPGIYDLPTNVSNLEQHYEDKVIPAISRYLDIVSIWFFDFLEENSDMSKNFNIDSLESFRSNFTIALFNATALGTRESRGVLELLQLVDNLLKKLEDTIGTVSSSIMLNVSESNSSASSVRRSGRTAASKKSFTVRKYFSELFDSETPKDIGMDFLSVRRDQAADAAEHASHMRTMSMADFTRRLSLEIDRHYVKASTNIVVNFGEERLSLNTNIDSTPIHLGPSVITLGKDRLSFINQGVDAFDRETNNLMASRILSYNSTGRLYNSKFQEQKGSKFNPTKQEKNYHLNNIASSFGVEAIPANNGAEAETTTSEIDSALGDNAQLADSDELQDAVQVSQEMSSVEYDPSETIAGLVSSLSTATDLSVLGDQTTIGQARASLTFDNLNPSTTRNIFSERYNARDNAEIISNMPLQMKSIVAAGANSTNVKIAWANLSVDPLLDARTANTFIFNYLQLQAVEMLTGYRLVDESITGYSDPDVMIKEPIFELATLEKMRNLGSREIFCRFKRFEDQDIPSVAGSGLDLPPYDSYFIVQNEQVAELTAESAENVEA